MNGPKAILVAVSALTGAIVFAVLLWSLAGFSRVEAVVVTVCLLVGAAAIVSFATRQNERSGVATDILDLRKITNKLSRDVFALQKKMEELDKSVEDRAKAHSDQVTAEVQILETLVKQLAEGMAQRERDDGEGTRKKSRGGRKRKEKETTPQDDAELLETVRRSLENNRVDLYLQPIVTLPQRRTMYYEGLTRLRDSDGNIIMPSAYLPIAENAGMMPAIDNLLLFRCVNVVRRLMERSRGAGVFCNISAHSLLDAEFFPQFIGYLEANPDLSEMLVFEFPQRIVSAFGPMERESLTTLADLGYRFSLDHITALDIDYASLADSNFQFVKVDAEILLHGMEEAGAQIHAADLREMLRRHGLELIAEKIEDERVVVDLLDFDITLAQGYLFGEPKLARGDLNVSSLAGLAKAG